jgi:hypothetical protein
MMLTGAAHAMPCVCMQALKIDVEGFEQKVGASGWAAQL